MARDAPADRSCREDRAGRRYHRSSARSNERSRRFWGARPRQRAERGEYRAAPAFQARLAQLPWRSAPRFRRAPPWRPASGFRRARPAGRPLSGLRPVSAAAWSNAPPRTSTAARSSALRDHRRTQAAAGWTMSSSGRHALQWSSRSRRCRTWRRRSRRAGFRTSISREAAPPATGTAGAWVLDLTPNMPRRSAWTDVCRFGSGGRRSRPRADPQLPVW